MGTWARRIIEIKMADASFNFRDNGDLIDFLNKEMDFDSSVIEGGGMVDVPLTILAKAIRSSAKLGLNDETVSNLQRDIAAAKSKKDECVLYYCF